jgi:hypothetical protein
VAHCNGFHHYDACVGPWYSKHPCGYTDQKFPNVDIMSSLYVTQVIIIAMLLAGAWKYQKLKHSATYWHLE